MLLVVTGVSFLIHIYSVGYMYHDPGFRRYFTFLNLFVFSMIMLVMANNFLLLYVFWEAVGLCSYLLIGFWYERKSASDAAKKAFIVNRIGDFGFGLGIMMIFVTLGTFDYAGVFSAAGHISAFAATTITLLLFVGATGKSAQIPLYVWLPDAMEGPTPVSALIHAATMVTAGVYMVARCYPLFEMAPATMQVVAVVGALTAIYAASIGLVQNDIKRVLAYSTISQLGYMFVGVGIGAYSSGIFHLATHAFFKALLFLGAGSVIHALAGEQDMRRMGGLAGKMRITTLTFVVASLAISGIPPFSGFFSKDEILLEAFMKGHFFIWLICLITAFMTAFYMFRMVFLTFFSESRVDKEKVRHVHESPKVMTVPLLVLAVCAAVAGLVALPPGENSLLNRYFGDTFEQYIVGSKGTPGYGQETEHSGIHGEPAGQKPPSLEFVLAAISTVVAGGGILLAWAMYRKGCASRLALNKTFAGVYRLLSNKYYVDEIYDKLIITPAYRASVVVYNYFDLLIIDGAVNGIGGLSSAVSSVLRRTQTGFIRNYALCILAGAVVIIGVLFWGRK
jgi:NADH-quinone oxidoreductase subunit L